MTNALSQLPRPLVDLTDVSEIHTEDVRIVAWGEPYRTAEDAEHRRLTSGDSGGAT